MPQIRAHEFIFIQGANARAVLELVGFTDTAQCSVGWVDIRTGTKVPLRFVTYLSKVTKIRERSVLTQ
jgi:hypothetical protein